MPGFEQHKEDFFACIKEHGALLLRLWMQSAHRYQKQLDVEDIRALFNDAVLRVLENPDSRTATGLAQALRNMDKGSKSQKRSARSYIKRWTNSRILDQIRSQKREQLVRSGNGATKLSPDTQAWLVEVSQDETWSEFAQNASKSETGLAENSLHPDFEELSASLGRFLVEELRKTPAKVREKVVATLARLQGVQLERLAALYGANVSTIGRWSGTTHEWVDENVRIWGASNRHVDYDRDLVWAGLYAAGSTVLGWLPGNT